MKKGNRVLWFGIGFVLVLLCVCGLGSLLLLGKAWTPMIDALTPTATWTREPTRRVMSTPTPTPLPMATWALEVSTYTPAPAIEPTLALQPVWCSLDDLMRRYDGMTSLQQAEFQREAVGKRVQGQVNVQNVTDTGTLYAYGGKRYTVIVVGLPLDVLMSLSPNQTIAIEGTIEDVETFEFGVYLKDALIR